MGFYGTEFSGHLLNGLIMRNQALCLLRRVGLPQSKHDVARFLRLQRHVDLNGATAI